MFKTCKKPPMSIITSSGSICTFNALQEGLPLKSHSVEVVATQSGSGTPSPSNPRPITGYSAINIWATGKNLVKYPYQTITNTWNGMSVVENNGVLTIEGTQNGVGSFIFGEVNLKKNITYTLSPFYDYLSGNELYMNLTLYDFNNNLVVKNVNLNSSSFTVNNDCTARLYLNPSSGANGKYFHFTVSPQIEVGNGTSYTLYNGTYTAITIGSTVYGGYYDVRTGVLTVTHGFEIYDGSVDETWDAFNIDLRMGVRGRTTANKSYVDSNISNIFDNSTSNETYADEANSYTWRSSPYVSNLVFFYVPLSENITSVEQWRTWLSNHPTTICYELATPTTIQLAPCPIDTLEGVNNIFADCGSTTLEAIKIGR